MTHSLKRTFAAIAMAALLTVATAARAGAQAPEPPKERLRADLPQTTGIVVMVGAPTPARLQAAIDAAKPGDRLVVSPGDLTAHLNFKNTPAGEGWITLTTSGALPAYGYRAAPDDSANMVRLTSPDTGPALDFWPTYAPAGVTKAHNWVIIGFDVRPSRAYSTNGGLVKMGAPNWQTQAGQAPTDIWIDRCLVRGWPDLELIRGIALNGARESVTGCWVSDCHSRGQDAQAVCGWAGPGPFRIVDNYLEASGENFMLGGADPRTPGLVPSDLEFRLNDCVKPRAWNPSDPAYAGRKWGVKNLFELKSCRRAVVESNYFEGCWVDGQTGYAMQLTPRNQDGGAPWTALEDVSVTSNVFSRVAAGVNVLGTDYNHPSGRASRIRLSGNTFLGVVGVGSEGENGRLFQVLDGVAGLEITHNTGMCSYAFLVFGLSPSPGLVFTDNIVSEGAYGLVGDDRSPGSDAWRFYAPGGSFERNAITGAANPSLYPAGNFFVR